MPYDGSFEADHSYRRSNCREDEDEFGESDEEHRGGGKRRDGFAGLKGPKKMLGAEIDDRSTILLVEDDRSVREMLSIVLQRLGHRVVAVEDGPRAIEVWCEKREEIGLLMTDLFLPGDIGGLDLARRFCSAKAALKVIVVSGYITDAVKKEAESRCEMVYLQKPFDQQKLDQVIRDLLASSRTSKSSCASEP